MCFRCVQSRLLLILRFTKRGDRERNILCTDKFNVFGIVAFFSLRFDGTQPKEEETDERREKTSIKRANDRIRRGIEREKIEQSSTVC